MSIQSLRVMFYSETHLRDHTAANDTSVVAHYTKSGIKGFSTDILRDTFESA